VLIDGSILDHIELTDGAEVSMTNPTGIPNSGFLTDM